MPRYPILWLIAALGLAACDTDEPPARSVQEFVDNPILLEAAIVRCQRSRAELRYDKECINAREAVKIVEAGEEAARRAELEAQSEAKRRELRSMQEARDEARRLSEEQQRALEEAEYHAQFGDAPPPQEAQEDELEGNVPGAIVVEGEDEDEPPNP
jgi:hypothetical protein